MVCCYSPLTAITIPLTVRGVVSSFVNLSIDNPEDIVLIVQPFRLLIITNHDGCITIGQDVPVTTLSYSLHPRNGSKLALSPEMQIPNNDGALTAKSPWLLHPGMAFLRFVGFLAVAE